MTAYNIKNSRYQSEYATYGGLSDSQNVSLNTRGEYILTPSELVTNLVSDPLWRTKVMKKLDATNQFKRMVCEVSPGQNVGFFRTKPQNIIDGSPNPSGVMLTAHRSQKFQVLPPITPGLGHAATRDRAIGQLRRKLDGATDQFKAIPPLAESKDLYKLVRGAVGLTKDVVGGLIDIKKGRFRDAYSKASDLWLTYSFGISPVMGDIAAVSNSILSYLYRVQPNLRFEGRATNRSFGTVKTSSITGARNASMTGVCQYHTDISYSIVAGMDFSVYAGNDYSVLDHFGINPPALIPAAWELTAFSWVVDYFSTVGDFLEDTFSVPAGNTVFVSETRKYEVTGLTSYSYDLNANTSVLFENKVPGAYRFLEIERTRLPSLPTRSLRLRTADEVGFNSLGKLLNLVSVLGK